MNDWFRSWHGAPTDPKWRTVAKRANVAPSLVVSVAWALMDRASQSDNRGSINGADIETLSDFLGCESDDIERIITALHDKLILDADRFVAWDRRQPKRERDDETAAERKRAQRERDKAKTGSGDGVTSDVTPRHTTSHHVTPRVDTEEIREDKIEPNPESQQPYDPAAARQAHAKRFEADDGPADDFREAEQACVKALGGSGGQGGIAPADAFFGPIMALVDQGFRLPDVVSVLKSERHRKRPKPVKSWSLWATIVAEQLAARPKLTSAKPADDPDDPRFDFGGGFSAPLSTIRLIAARGQWLDQWGPRIGEPGCRVPEHLVGAVH